jgi:hypothetical protein
MKKVDARQLEIAMCDGLLTRVEVRTALDFILDRESDGENTPERADALAAFLQFVFRDNPDDPVLVVRRLYAIVYEFKPELLRGMSQHRIASYLGFTKQAFSKLIINWQEKRGTRRHGRNQKSYSAREKYRNGHKAKDQQQP